MERSGDADALFVALSRRGIAASGLDKFPERRAVNREEQLRRDLPCSDEEKKPRRGRGDDGPARWASILYDGEIHPGGVPCVVVLRLELAGRSLGCSVRFAEGWPESEIAAVGIIQVIVKCQCTQARVDEWPRRPHYPGNSSRRSGVRGVAHLEVVGKPAA